MAQVTERASEALALRVRQLIERIGLKEAAQQVKVGTRAVAHLAGRIPVSRGTVALAEAWALRLGESAVIPWPAPSDHNLVRHVPEPTKPRRKSAPTDRTQSSLSAPNRPALERALTLAIKGLQDKPPSIPWRITIGQPDHIGESAITLDLSECSRAWGCSAEAAAAASEPLGAVNDEVLSDPACWDTTTPASPFTRIARFAAKRIALAHETMTGRAAPEPQGASEAELALERKEQELAEQTERARVAKEQLEALIARAQTGAQP